MKVADFVTLECGESIAYKLVDGNTVGCFRSDAKAFKEGYKTEIARGYGDYEIVNFEVLAKKSVKLVVSAN